MIDLDAIEARAKAATPNWRAVCDYTDDLRWLCNDKDYGEICSGDRRIFEFRVERTDAEPDTETNPADKAQVVADVEFAVHAREDIPALIAEVRRLREALALVQWGSCDGCGGMHYCPECGAHSSGETHLVTCRVGKALDTATVALDPMQCAECGHDKRDHEDVFAQTPNCTRNACPCDGFKSPEALCPPTTSSNS